MRGGTKRKKVWSISAIFCSTVENNGIATLKPYLRITPKRNRQGTATKNRPIHDERFALMRTSLSCLWCAPLMREGGWTLSSFLINFSSSIADVLVVVM